MEDECVAPMPQSHKPWGNVCGLLANHKGQHVSVYIIFKRQHPGLKYPI